MFCHMLGGNKVELSSATVAFTKGVLGFVADGLGVNTPQVMSKHCITIRHLTFRDRDSTSTPV